MKLLKMLGKRIGDLIGKMISVKGLVLAIATFLRYNDKMEDWTWMLCALAIISIRMFEKKILGDMAEQPDESNIQGLTG